MRKRVRRNVTNNVDVKWWKRGGRTFIVTDGFLLREHCYDGKRKRGCNGKKEVKRYERRSKERTQRRQKEEKLG